MLPHIFQRVIGLKKYLGAGGAAVMVVILLVYAQDCSQAVIRGLQLCGTAVIPALFPMFVASKLFIAKAQQLPLPRLLQRVWRRLFGTGGICAYGTIFGLLGGYPLGVSVICELYENKCISREDAEHSLRFCNNSGPAFFIAVLGAKVFQDISVGLMLYGIHVLSALMLGILFRRQSHREACAIRTRPSGRPFGALFMDAIQSSCASLLQICGLILFFTTLNAVMHSIGLFQLIQYLPFEGIEALLQGSMELTGGIFRLPNTKEALLLAAFLMGWGGFCIHFQASILWQKVGLSPKGYYVSKLLHGLLSVYLVWMFYARSVILSLCLLFAVILTIFGFRRKCTGNSDRYAL